MSTIFYHIRISLFTFGNFIKRYYYTLYKIICGSIFNTYEKWLNKFIYKYIVRGIHMFAKVWFAKVVDIHTSICVYRMATFLHCYNCNIDAYIHLCVECYAYIPRCLYVFKIILIRNLYLKGSIHVKQTLLFYYHRTIFNKLSINCDEMCKKLNKIISPL